MKHLLCLLLLALAMPALGEAEQTPPNVLFIIADDLAANALGCYGNEQVKTPHIDKLAKRGTVMDRAYCQYPVCGPARAALLSGQYPQENGVTNNSDKDILSKSLGDHPTLPQYFKQNGYTTIRLGKLYHMRVPGHITAGISGPDHPASWTEAHNFKSDEQWTPGKSYQTCKTKLKPDPNRDIHYGLGYGPAFFVVEDPTDGAEQHDVKATDKAIELLRSDMKDKPFFLAVGYVRPHVPLVAPQKYFDALDVTKLTVPTYPRGDRLDIPKLGITGVGERRGPDTHEKRQQTLRAYYASVSFMDAQVGRLIEELESQGLSDNTIIIFKSDHGYHLGEHDFWQKMSLHEESARIPLIAAGPGIEKGQRWPGLVEAVDIYPTLSVMAGLPIPKGCSGTLLYGMEDDPKTLAYTYKGNGHLIRTKDWAYMRYKDDSEELYDMNNDPKQFANLAKDAGSAKALSSIRGLLDEKLKKINN